LAGDSLLKILLEGRLRFENDDVGLLDGQRQQRCIPESQAESTEKI